MASELPPLLYLSDVPPELSPGNMPLYRLLQNYPPDRLLVVLGNGQNYQFARRLPGPRYEIHRIARFPRLLYTRFASQYAAWLFRTCHWGASRLDPIVDQFKPEAIFTVAHSFTWLVADAVSQRHGIPLHLAVWDDFVRQARLTPRMRKFAEPRFADVYRRAASRLCISPNMAEIFEDRYGVSGEVLYPLRAADLLTFEEPPPRLAQDKKRLTFAFAGSVNYGPYAEMLGKLAAVLAERGHLLLVFAAIPPSLAQSSGIVGSHVTIVPVLPPDELQRRMREEVDVLFVPMAFEPEYELDMRISFPSKLSDYTAVALPLLIWAPPYCSAVRWASENPGSAVLVQRDDRAALVEGIAGLETDALTRQTMGRLAAQAGKRTFDHGMVTEKLYKTIADSVRR